MIKSLFKYLAKQLYRITFLRKFLDPYIPVVERRLYTRHSINKLSDVLFIASCENLENHQFYLKDISLGGLSFFLDSHEQEQIFKSGKMVKISLTFLGSTFEGQCRVAFSAKGFAGCQIITKKQEYKMFVTEKMSDLLVKSNLFK
jgi:hypothetical protein